MMSEPHWLFRRLDLPHERNESVGSRNTHTCASGLLEHHGMHSCFSLKSKSNACQLDLITKVAHNPQDGITDKFIHAAKLETCTHSSPQKHLINLSL